APSLSSSQGVVLTAYHHSSKDWAIGESHGQGGEEATFADMASMNQEITKAKEKPPFDQSSSMDELSMEDYWNEIDNIKKSSENRQNQEVVVIKEPDMGELEEWLKEAGLSNLFGESAGDPQESMVFLSTLTQQAAAVQKWVENISQTLRKKNKQYHIPVVRDIFESKEKAPGGSESQSVRINKKYQGKDDQASILVVGEKLMPLVPEEAPASEIVINLEVSPAEQAVNQKDSSDRNQKSKGNNAPLPNFRLPKNKTGTTRIGNLTTQDMKKVCYLALIELTTLYYDVLGVEMKQQKLKIKTKDSDPFCVPLTVLLEQDQRKVPGTQISLIFQKLIDFSIEEGGLETDSLLRIPGAVIRMKNLCQALEAKFYEGTFNWENVKQPDAASLLKLFICELPQPLFSVEYLKAFQAVQILPIKKQQLQALNLLVILLHDANQDTLKALLEFLQRIIDTVINVAMVMAPNLFMCQALSLKFSKQREFVMVAGTANAMHYQKLLWTIPKFLVNQMRKQNTKNLKKDEKNEKLMKKMAYDQEKYEKK
uniref:Rho-GAP domain-containing protein n=1 Tax=Myotis lucifugus TaxID=59463 RepID=G1PYX1_MYOLU